jgi:hypothetical protein
MTLDPNKFAEKNQQCLHIGNQQSFIPNVMLHNQSSPVQLFYDKSDRNNESGTTISSTYPPDTKSFLYYFMPPDKPRIAAELRLRVTSCNHPASFESGSDLLKSNGQLWSRPLWMLPRCYNPLYEKLREDRLVPDDLDAVLSTFTSLPPKFRRSQFLYTFNDTFIIDFSCYHHNFLVITEQGVEKVRTEPFRDRRGGPKDTIIPYTGTFTNHHLSIILLNKWF